MTIQKHRGAIKQTAATKIRSRNFGIAATAGKILREHFGDRLPFPKDKRMQSRFAGAIAKWLGSSDAADLPPENDLGYISGFAFNQAGSIAAIWKVPLTVTRETDQLIILHIPAFIPAEKILVPPGTVKVICTIAAASWNWHNPNLQNSAGQILSIPYNNEPVPAQQLPLVLPASQGCLLVTIAALECIDKMGERDNRYRYRPCNVVDARFC